MFAVYTIYRYICNNRQITCHAKRFPFMSISKSIHKKIQLLLLLLLLLVRNISKIIEKSTEVQ